MSISRPGRRHTDGNRRDRRHDFYYGRPPSRDSSLNDSLATSQISDSEVSMYDNRRTRHAGFDRHPAMGVHQVHDSRNFKPQVLRSHPPQSQISAGMIPEEMRGNEDHHAMLIYASSCLPSCLQEDSCWIIASTGMCEVPS